MYSWWGGGRASLLQKVMVPLLLTLVMVENFTLKKRTLPQRTLPDVVDNITSSKEITLPQSREHYFIVTVPDLHLKITFKKLQFKI